MRQKLKAVRRRLLIAEADGHDRATNAAALRDAGYDVIEAASGIECLRRGIEDAPDLAIVDDDLAEMPGIEVLRHLRMETNIPVLFMSSGWPTSVARQVAQLGAIGNVIKPAPNTQLIAAVEAGLARGAEIASLRNTELQLSLALSAGRDTSTATGLMMERHHLSREAAFDSLREYARTHSRKITEVAAELIQAQETLNAADARRKL